MIELFSCITRSSDLLVINLLLLLYSVALLHRVSILSKFWSSWATVTVGVDSSLCWHCKDEEDELDDEEQEEEVDDGALALPAGCKVNSWRERRPKTLPIALLSSATLSILSRETFKSRSTTLLHERLFPPSSFKSIVSTGTPSWSLEIKNIFFSMVFFVVVVRCYRDDVDPRDPAKTRERMSRAFV